FDAVMLLPSETGAQELLGMAPAIDWLRDAFGHLKVIGFNEAARRLLDKAWIEPSSQRGVLAIDDKKGIDGFIAAAKKYKIWDREPLVRPPGCPIPRNRLSTYRAKRDFPQPDEPWEKAAIAPAPELRFVVQRPDATRLHYDFRLELDGVFKSW